MSLVFDKTGKIVAHRTRLKVCVNTVLRWFQPSDEKWLMVSFVENGDFLGYGFKKVKYD